MGSADGSRPKMAALTLLYHGLFQVNIHPTLVLLFIKEILLDTLGLVQDFFRQQYLEKKVAGQKEKDQKIEWSACSQWFERGRACMNVYIVKGTIWAQVGTSTALQFRW